MLRINPNFSEDYISPTRNTQTVDLPWEGVCEKKPWEYKVSAAIPCLDTYDTLELAVTILKMQTIRPYIIIIDTGSCSEELKKIESLRDEDVEVHSLKLNGTQHPSDYPAIAMDLAFSLCRTDYMFATHADCFLRRRDFLEFLLEQMENYAVAGYQLSPRKHGDWEFMVSHTATMYNMKIMDKIGFGWSLRRLCNSLGVEHRTPDPMRPNWPDTEILGNYILRENKIKPLLIGKEQNHCRNLDQNIDHPRSYTAAKLYSPNHLRKMSSWVEKAKKDAKKRIKQWQRDTWIAQNEDKKFVTKTGRVISLKSS